MRCARATLTFLAVALGASGVAWGGPPERLRMIDQRYEDADELAISLRVLNHDLRHPAGFSQLFEDTANPGTYVRISGALYQVSRETEYRVDREGLYAPIAAGTVFYIGEMPATAPAPGSGDSRSGLGSAATSLVRSVAAARTVMLAQLVTPQPARVAEMRAPKPDRAKTPLDEPAAPDDLADERTRAARLRAIAARAAGAL